MSAAPVGQPRDDHASCPAALSAIERAVPEIFGDLPASHRPHNFPRILYSYGAHNLRRQYGYHLVYNNRYNVNGVAAGVTLCMGYNRKGSEFGGPLMNARGWWAPVNLTRVNSIPLWLYNRRYYRFVNCGG